MKVAIQSIYIGFIVATLLTSCFKPDQSSNPDSADPGTAPPHAFNEFVDEFLASVRNQKQPFVADLKEIIERDTLRAITTYSSTSYFLYRGEPMGYEYELAERLANHLNVKLKMIVADDLNELFVLLNEGVGDIVTHNLTVTTPRMEVVDFTLPLNFTHQVLVQRKPDNWREMKLHEIENSLIRNPIELIDKEIFVRESSSYRFRLENLEEELGGDIQISFLAGNNTTDEIIKMVADGEIDYTVADHNIAKINASYYKNLDIRTTIGVMQRLAWAVRKTSPDLLKAVNEWIQEERKEADYYVIYNKYYKNTRDYTRRIKSELYSMEGEKISPYDELIKTGAQQLSWDWRFLASLIYQESQFDPAEKSWVGATGLMQLMPKTAKSYGYTRLTNPNSNIKAGVAHLKYLSNYWSSHIPDSLERVKFVLASYNAGQYHVQDARRLAKKLGKDPNRWSGHVAEMILLKSIRKYYNDPVVKFGYCRGEEPVNYVNEIFERYNYYTQFVPEQAIAGVGS